eukprot:jgi/Mesvir1/1497/Mv14480-RA.1
MVWFRRAKKKARSMMPRPSDRISVRSAVFSDHLGAECLKDSFTEMLRARGGALAMPSDSVIARMAPWMSGSHKSFSVTYELLGKRYAVVYSLEDPAELIRFPPYKTVDDVVMIPPPQQKRILSATIGHYVPTDEDADITAILEELAGPEGDFYERVGCSQHVWCVVRHVMERLKSEFDQKYIRVIYGNGTTSVFHPLTGGCMNTGAVSLATFYSLGDKLDDGLRRDGERVECVDS